MNNKKIVAEIILIPLCIFYIIFMFLKSDTIAYILFTVFSLIGVLWFAPKYLKEVYVYESKNNFLKIFISISYILLGILSILNLFMKFKIIKILLLVFSCIVFIHLLYFSIKNIKEIIKLKKEFGMNIIYSFISFLIFTVMLSSLIILLR